MKIEAIFLDETVKLLYIFFLFLLHKLTCIYI